MRAGFALFLLLAAALSFDRASRYGIAAGYIDPLAKIKPQDEALYAHSSVRMAQHGDWLTPMFLGRYGLYKPPLLMWLSGAGLKLFGISRVSLRAPVILAAAFACALLFWWVGTARGWIAGACAAFLLLANSLWQTLAALALTDGILAAALLCAMYALDRDPPLASRRWFLVLAVAAAAGILTKSYAGLAPLMVAIPFWVLSKPRPPLRRILALGALVAALSAPWFLYQLLVHTRWFWAEHVLVELLAYGAGRPRQTTGEPQLLFYARRLWLDPLLLAFLALALPRWLPALRRDHSARLMAVWIAVLLAIPLLWGYRNAAYLLPVVPALAIVAARWFPFPRWQAAMLVIVAAAALARPITNRERATVASGDDLSRYCAQQRRTELISLDTADEFFSALLPLPEIRYLFQADAEKFRRQALDFRSLGILASGREFLDLDSLTPLFHQRLREMGLDSAEPIATTIFAASVEEVRQIIRSRPGSDFFLPAAWRVIGPFENHTVQETDSERFFLLAKHPRRITGVPLTGACYW